MGLGFFSFSGWGVMELVEETEGNEQDSALIWAIRYLECDAVEERLAAGVTQHLLDCGLHEVATGERDIPAHQESRLHIAQLLVECGADPDNRQHGCGGTPLHHSLARGYLELVKFLLDAQADVNACNRHGVHPLHIAVKRGYCDCIEYLMKWGLPLQKVKEELSWAVKFDMSESVCCLLSNGAPHGLRVQCPPSALSTRHRNARDYSLPLGYYVVMRGWHIEVMLDVLCKGWTRLQEAVACGRVEEATKIIEDAADGDPTIWEPSKPYNASLLHLAVFSGSMPMLNMLLGLTTSGLSACCTDCFKRSALCYAACKEEPMMAIELIAASCDPNLQDRDGRTALHIAASMGHTQTLEVLLRSGGDPMMLDVHKNTCVHCAAIEGKCSALSLLMSHEPALFALYERNSDELTPLHQATSTGDTRCLEVLLNADPFLVDLRVKDEGTSLHIACEKGHASALRLLLRAGGDVEAHVTQFEDPRTPLHLAAEYAHEECVALMLEYGADVFAELPLQFLQQFKNFRLLSHHLKRASCHAAALSAHFKDEGWKQCVALLDSAVEARRLSGSSNRSTRQAALSLSTAIAEVKGNHDGPTPRMGKSFTDGGGPRMKHNAHANGLTAVQQATGRRREQHDSSQADKSGDSQSTTSLCDAQYAARDTE
ncbi:hypothetical protein AB1Y20_000964 [Prymnesium parvum]|uniref:Uncharacterized protein n=1 Tax=Prymnesium parvum TaxID=97485 RepID=A0AB34K6D7_PRYPA